MKVLVTIDKFGATARNKLESVCNISHQVVYKKTDRVLTRDELKELISIENPDIIIAGTERYDAEIFDLCSNLKVISRVGIGLDSVDLDECAHRNIIVTNTPDAPTNAVAELTVGQIINAARKLQETDNKIRQGIWERHVGKDLSNCTVGIIGYGRIGSSVANKVKNLVKQVLIYDIDTTKVSGMSNVRMLGSLLHESDIVTIHIPMTNYNKNFITIQELNLMKSDSILVNTSRGGIVDEKDLYSWLVRNPSATAVLDVFVQEPYKGELTTLTNCYLTSHLGSCTFKARHDMEVGSVQNIIEFLQ